MSCSDAFVRSEKVGCVGARDVGRLGFLIDATAPQYLHQIEQSFWLYVSVQIPYDSYIHLEVDRRSDSVFRICLRLLRA